MHDRCMTCTVFSLHTAPSALPLAAIRNTYAIGTCPHAEVLGPRHDTKLRSCRQPVRPISRMPFTVGKASYAD